MKHFRRYIVAGLLVWVPLGVTLLVLKLVADVVQGLVRIPAAWRPEQLLGVELPYLDVVLTLLAAIVVLYLTGLIVTNILGRQLVSLWEAILERIPLVRSIYSAAKNFAEVLFADTGESGIQEGAADRVPAQGSLQPVFPDRDRSAGSTAPDQR